MKPLSDVASFGAIDADFDDLLDTCFQDHEAYASALAHERFLVVGRKGAGKTAIFKKIIRTRRHNFSRSVTPSPSTPGITTSSRNRSGFPRNSAMSTAGSA